MSVLESIVDRSRVELQRRRLQRPESELRSNLGVSARDFAGALAGPGLSLIAEFKPKSPSRGQLRSRDEVETFAELYDGRASAMSVLCDRVHFDGGYDLLHRASVSCQLPVLCKDFIFEPYQVFEARAAGADAVLLMAAVIDDTRIEELSDLSSELGMDSLVEVHDEAELDRVLALGQRIVGINARNLHDLSIDPARLKRLIDAVPDDRIVVAESGIETRGDIDGLPPRADAVLIGSAFMTAEDPAGALEELGW